MKNVQLEIQNKIEESIESGMDEAVQVAVYKNGDLIVDVCASSDKFHIDRNTLFPFFSTGKGIAVTATLRLVEKGVVALDVPVAEYWPEFGCKGKESITLRNILNHTAGMHLMPQEEISPLNWESMCRYLEQAEPAYVPGTKRAYHAITFSWLLGETLQRADGRSLRQIIDDEVLKPLNIDSVFFGLPDDKFSIALDAIKESEPDTKECSGEMQQSAIPHWICPLEDWINRRDIRKECIPSSNGFGNAIGIAKHYASLIGNGVDGVRLLSEDTVEQATIWDKSECERLGWGDWGIYKLDGPDNDRGSVFGHGGYGGSLGIADKKHQLAIAVVKNKMGGGIAAEVQKILSKL